MGRFSIDNFEKYPTLVVRPMWIDTPPVNAGYGVVQALPDDEPNALILKPDADGWTDTAWMLAEKGLQRHWREHPVYAWLNSPPDEWKKAELMNWHVKAANFDAALGADVRLRRLTCPKTLSSGGALPLRLWFDNAGSSPVYGAMRVVIRLDGKETFDIALNTKPGLLRKVGDIVHNEIVRLPDMRPGTYAMSVGVSGPDGVFRMNVAGEEHEGFHALCDVPVDGIPRPELFHAWDDYYPEGYYPLEDPKEPLRDYCSAE